MLPWRCFRRGSRPLDIEHVTKVVVVRPCRPCRGRLLKRAPEAAYARRRAFCRRDDGLRQIERRRVERRLRALDKHVVRVVARARARRIGQPRELHPPRGSRICHTPDGDGLRLDAPPFSTFGRVLGTRPRLDSTRDCACQFAKRVVDICDGNARNKVDRDIYARRRITIHVGDTRRRSPNKDRASKQVERCNGVRDNAAIVGLGDREIPPNAIHGVFGEAARSRDASARRTRGHRAAAAEREIRRHDIGSVCSWKTFLCDGQGERLSLGLAHRRLKPARVNPRREVDRPAWEVRRFSRLASI